MMENPVYAEPVSTYVPGEIILLTPEEKHVTKPFSFAMPIKREVTIRVPAGYMDDAIRIRDMLGLNKYSVIISLTN
jgi:hypothetical protein